MQLQSCSNDHSYSHSVHGESWWASFTSILLNAEGKFCACAVKAQHAGSTWHFITIQPRHSLHNRPEKMQNSEKTLQWPFGLHQLQFLFFSFSFGEYVVYCFGFTVFTLNVLFKSILTLTVPRQHCLSFWNTACSCYCSGCGVKRHIRESAFWVNFQG